MDWGVDSTLCRTPHILIFTILSLPVQAILLGGLAFKRRWQEKRKAAGLKEAVTPNIVCSSAVHVRS